MCEQSNPNALSSESNADKDSPIVHTVERRRTRSMSIKPSQRDARGDEEDSPEEDSASSIEDSAVDPREPDYLMAPKKRKYTYHTRVKAPDRQPSGKRRRFNDHADVSQSYFEGLQCCERKKCFSVVNLAHLTDKSKTIMKMSGKERKQALQNMLTTGDVFMFDGRPVCSEFLVKAFRFSRDLQCSVKGTIGSSSQNRRTQTTSHSELTRSKDAIAVFLRRIADQSGNHMPDSKDVHLPFYDKIEVYKLFCAQFEALEGRSPPKASYFYAVWRAQVDHVKIRRVTRFTQCPTCEEFKVRLRESARSGKLLTEVTNARKAHVSFIAQERQAYKMNMDNAILNPRDYMSIVIDGADQSAFGLPHFTTITKNTKGHSLKVKLIGVLEHAAEKRVGLYTMTENFETGANHVIESMHRFLDTRNGELGLAKILTIQMDNCTRENKNRYTMAYLESLVSWGVFMEVRVSFLPIGHTHTDIDQVFSRTAVRLHSHDAITLQDLHHQLSNSYTPEPRVNHITQVVNFSGLCETTKVLKNMKEIGFSQYRYFRFTKNGSANDDIGENACKYPTICQVKMNSTDEWKPLRQTDSSGFGGFLTDTPNLAKTPQLELKKPSNEAEVRTRLDSEDVRIANAEKMKTLEDLVDDVYSDRSEPFHWDLQSCFEMKVVRSQQPGLLDPSPEDEPSRSAQLKYAANEFLAVRHTRSTKKDPFWVAKISDVVKEPDGTVTSLVVHWYEKSSNAHPFDATYVACNLSRGRRNSFTPWAEDIHPDMVICTFDGLTSKNTLTKNTVKK